MDASVAFNGGQQILLRWNHYPAHRTGILLRQRLNLIEHIISLHNATSQICQQKGTLPDTMKPSFYWIPVTWRIEQRVEESQAVLFGCCRESREVCYLSGTLRRSFTAITVIRIRTLEPMGCNILKKSGAIPFQNWWIQFFDSYVMQ